MNEPKPVYTITPDIDMGHTCPTCVDKVATLAETGGDV